MTTQQFGLIVCGLVLPACATRPTPKTNKHAPQYVSSLDVSPQVLLADGIAQAQIHLSVRDSRGAPVSNVRATFDVEDPERYASVWLVQPGPTDSNGKTSGIVVAESAGPLSIACRLPVLGQDAAAFTVLHTQLECVAPD